MEWINALLQQFGAITKAPVPFVMAVAIVAYGVFRFTRHQMSERIANLEARISLRDDEIALRKEREQIAGGTRSNSANEQSVAAPVKLPARPTTQFVKVGSTDREFLDSSISPQALMALCRDKTSLQAQRLTAPYIGKWMFITGALRNVSENSPESHYAAVDVPLANVSYPATLWLDFARKEPVLETLSPGAVVRAAGRIEKIKASSMDFEDCELIT